MIDLCIHGAIVPREIIRDKDKDPSFSAKEARSADARVWAGSRNGPGPSLMAKDGGLSPVSW